MSSTNLERDFDILPRDGPGQDFDSLSSPGIFRDSHGTEGKKGKKLTIFADKKKIDNV